LSSILRAAWAIAGKDLSVEWRSRTALISTVAFAVLVSAILFFARDPTAVSALDQAPAALWVTFSFSAMVALNRAFQLEQENRALDGLLLSPIPRPAIFIGKTLANLAFVGAVEVVALPVFLLFYDLPFWHRLPALLGVVALATLAMVTVGTLFSSMVVRTRFAEFMLPLLLLPFLVPPVICGVELTTTIFANLPLSAGIGWLKLLLAFDIAFVALSVVLFESSLDQ
jgi:heme exporter protein B